MDYKTTNGVWLLPSRNRPHNLRRFFEHCQLTGLKTPGFILVNKDDYVANREKYLDLLLPEGWSFIAQDSNSLGESLDQIWPYIKDRDWVGLICDDNIPATPDWDTALVGAATGWNFVTCNDNWQAPQRATGAYVFSGNWLRAVGHLTLPGTHHLYMDDMWETIGRATESWACRMDVLVRHEHYLKDPTLADGEYQRTNSPEYYAHDKAQLDAWIAGNLDETVKRVNALKESFGVTKHEFDVTGISVMICTPIADKPEPEFVGSLYGTMMMLHEKHIPYTWVVESGNADIVAARAELFHTFLKSGFTHCFMVDADMGWEPMALARLLYAKKDFVAIAGRRKRDAPTYALNPLTKDGKFADIYIEPESACCEIMEVGMAFTLFSRQCVEKMVAGYPELKYRNASGVEMSSLCMPLITDDGYYKAEDYAFCHRWRKLGEKVYLVPDVSLKHVGKKSWEGAWSDTWEKRGKSNGPTT